MCCVILSIQIRCYLFIYLFIYFSRIIYLTILRVNRPICLEKSKINIKHIRRSTFSECKIEDYYSRCQSNRRGCAIEMSQSTVPKTTHAYPYRVHMERAPSKAILIKIHRRLGQIIRAFETLLSWQLILAFNGICFHRYPATTLRGHEVTHIVTISSCWSTTKRENNI